MSAHVMYLGWRSRGGEHRFLLLRSHCSSLGSMVGEEGSTAREFHLANSPGPRPPVVHDRHAVVLRPEQATVLALLVLAHVGDVGRVQGDVLVPGKVVPPPPHLSALFWVWWWPRVCRSSWVMWPLCSQLPGVSRVPVMTLTLATVTPAPHLPLAMPRVEST